MPLDPLKPWPGYEFAEPAQRCQRLQKACDQAKLHGDQAYVLALTSAVVNYELVLQVEVAHVHDSETLARARQLYRDANGWLPA